MKQAQLIHQFNDKFRPKFNQDLFTRYDDDIINAIKNVILSCERDSTFTIKVLDFTVIDNYDEIMHILWAYEDSIINKNKKKEEIVPTTTRKTTKPTTRKKDNQFDYINLKDSDIKLIKVDYFIQITEKKDGLVSDTITVYIAVPRIVDKFYFRINGNVYSAMYQIVDASTYNNSAAKNTKKQTITFKTMFMPIRTYRYLGCLTTLNKESVPCYYFLGNMFKKSLLMMKYLFAKFGYYDCLSFFGISDIYIMKTESLSVNEFDDFYIFEARKDICVTVPKYLFDNSQIVQSLVYTINAVVNHMRDVDYNDFFARETWVKSLGAEFASKAIDTIYSKGISILGSLEFIYDKTTKEDLKLDDNNKSDIYRVLRWIMYEFNALRLKDNLNITTKKVVYADYIASLYGTRLATGIYRLSDKGDKADLNTIRKSIQIPPMYLLNAISKCQLVNYKNCVNDLDSITALKFTYKGISGIGEKANAIPGSYRSIHPSHLGKVDLDSSSASDPGISGTICPLTTLSDKHFTEFEESNTWESDLNKLISQYKIMNNKVEIARIVKNENLSNKQINNDILNECVSINKSIIDICMGTNEQSEYIYGYDVFGDGILYYTEEE